MPSESPVIWLADKNLGIGHDYRSPKFKANEIAELMEYMDMHIGQSLGILKQSSLVKG